MISRKNLNRQLASAIVKHGKVKTTLARAKAARPFVERLVTIAKRGDLTARRRILALLGGKRETAKKALGEVGPKFKTRSGGYTRIVKLGPRPSDAAEMARLEWVGGKVRNLKSKA